MRKHLAYFWDDAGRFLEAALGIDLGHAKPRMAKNELRAFKTGKAALRRVSNVSRCLGGSYVWWAAEDSNLRPCD